MYERYLRVIQRYYRGCNLADVALMRSTFAKDVVHYFVDHEPIRGDDQLAQYWARVGPRTSAQWSVDHGIASGAEAVIEWSMRWTPASTKRQETLRGTEWYVFAGERIAEIRSYHNNYYLQSVLNRELRGFDYAARGYFME